VKFLTTLLSALSAGETGSSVRALVRLVVVLLISVLAFSIGFHQVMAFEGREFSWTSSIYWTVVTMTTLGYGDITFTTDLGRMYSLLVLIAGSILILVLLPFTFIQVVYLPWRAAARRAGAPRELPASTRDHVVLTELDPVADALIDRLTAAGVPYVLVDEDVERALNLREQGYRVAVGNLDDPDTYRNLRADRAAMLFTSRSDETNTNIVSTWREVTDAGAVVATARNDESIDILQLVGTDHVLQPAEVLGKAFARRILAPTERSSDVATFGDLMVAEASAAGTSLAGQTLGELRLRERFGVTVAGLWDRGALRSPTTDARVEDDTILILIGTPDQVERYDDAVDPGGEQASLAGGVVVLGGGRVGRAAARNLVAAGTPVRVVERDPSRPRSDADTIIGDAADRAILEEAGIDHAAAVVVTTHDDDTNIYLTLYVRRLRPDIEVIGRVDLDRNVSTLHRAGADLVLSYASTGATEVWNVLRGESALLLAEGLLLFAADVPPKLANRRLADTDLRPATGCTVVGIVRNGTTDTDVGPDTLLAAGTRLVLVGTDDAEERFLRRYVSNNGRGGPLARLLRTG
jgi:voltage-gated potassium channel